MTRQRIVLALAAALLVLLALNQFQHQRDLSALQLGRADKARLTEGGDRRITYPAGALPQFALPDGQLRSVRSLLKVEHQLHHGEFV